MESFTLYLKNSNIIRTPFNGKNVTFNGGWCEGQPAGTLKEVYLQATTYCRAEMPTSGWRPKYTSYLCEVHATMTTGQ